MSKFAQTDCTIAEELKEREKELDCLYRLTPLFTSYNGMENPLLRQISIELTKAMTNPGTLDISLSIVAREEDFPNSDKGDFYTETRLNNEEKLTLLLHFTATKGVLVSREEHLLKSALDLSAAAIQRLRNEASIKEKNTTLTELLTRLQREREKDAESIQVRIRTSIFPLLNQLNQQLREEENSLVSMIQSELEELTQNGRNFNSLVGILTPREMEICSFVVKGISSKVIASSLKISVETVERHRCTIRKKLNLNGTSINLTTYLTNL